MHRYLTSVASRSLLQSPVNNLTPCRQRRVWAVCGENSVPLPEGNPRATHVSNGTLGVFPHAVRLLESDLSIV